MRHTCFAILVFILLSPLFCFSQPGPRHVLLLNSYNQRMTWVRDIVRAVEDVLAPDNNNIILHIANMDAKQFHSQAYFSAYKTFLKHKYRDRGFSLILSSDNHAFDFLMRHRDELFMNIPVVFCGVNDFRDEQIQGKEGVTGVAEIFSARKTAELALKLHPGTREIYIVNDYLETGRAWQRDMEADLAPLKEKVELTYSGDLSMGELKSEIAGLGKGTIIILGVFFSDRKGEYFTYEKTGEMISEASRVPVYCLLEFNVGKGIIGGEVICGYSQGEAMAKIGRQILEGTAPDHIPVLKKGVNRPVFEYSELKRFGLKEKALPDQALVINRPYSVFQEYKSQLITLFTMFLLLMGTVVALLLNILKRSRAEEALKESEQRLSLHLQNTPVGAISWDTKFRVVEWNPAARTIFGYTRKEAAGRPATELILPPDVAGQAREIFKKLLSETGGTRSINENIRKNGERITCAWYNTTLKKGDGTITGVASLVTDITERRKTRELMIQTEKMMSVGGLAAGMAHEINNPLAGMIQSAQVIHNRLTRDIPANTGTARDLGMAMADIRTFMERREILRHLENIARSGNRAAKIIENMLSFVRKKGSAKQKCHLPDLLEKTLSLAENDYDLKKKYDFRQIKITREYEPKIPPVPCQESEIRQVLFNLIKNASHALHSVKKKTAPRLTLRLWQEKEMACIEVGDNGPGMDHDTRKRVFEPFFTTKGVDKGTGLGLSVSYFIIVDNHNGAMEVDSAPGAGTKFTIKLPISPIQNRSGENP